MVQSLRDLPISEPEMSIVEVGEHQNSKENKEVRVVQSSLGLKRIITILVSVWLVINIFFLLKTQSTRVTRSKDLVVNQGEVVVVSEAIFKNKGLWLLRLQPVQAEELLVVGLDKCLVRLGFMNSTKRSSASEQKTGVLLESQQL